MGRYIDWYLVEVERRIGNLVPRGRLHETLLEVESHLMDAKNAAVQLGLEDSKAELAAIEAFGSPKRLVGACCQTNTRWVHVGLHVIAGILASGGMFLLAATLSTHTEVWPFILVALVTGFVFLSAKATSPLRWQILALMVAASTLVQVVVGGVVHAPFESHSRTSFIPRSKAAAILDGRWEQPKTLSKTIRTEDEDLRARPAPP